MSVHIAIPHLHLPDWPRLRRVLEQTALAASSAGWACAAATVVGLGYGRHLTVVLSAAALLYAGYLAGAHRANAVWSARHRRVMEALQRSNSAQQREAARRRAELADYAEADRDPHTSRKDRYLNSRTRPGVGQPTKGSR